jgi:FkbM family methyltransferase
MRAQLRPAIFSGKQDDSPLKDAFFKNSPNGFFVEVGAFEPIKWSQTWHFEQRGWNGVLVEANPEKAEILRHSRKAAVYNVACSSRANSGRTMPFYLAGMYSSLLSESMTTGVTANRQIEVTARTLDEILIDAKAPTPIDFISIDVEGHDLEVLDGLDLDRWRPRLIAIEDLALGLRLHRELSSRGYQWICRIGLNGWYAPAEQAGALSLFGRWQFLRKYYLSLPFRHLREWKRRVVGSSRPLGEYKDQ